LIAERAGSVTRKNKPRSAKRSDNCLISVPRVAHSSAPASGAGYLWNRKKARDETLENRGKVGSRIVLKRDRACFEEGKAAADSCRRGGRDVGLPSRSRPTSARQRIFYTNSPRSTRRIALMVRIGGVKSVPAICACIVGSVNRVKAKNHQVAHLSFHSSARDQGVTHNTNGFKIPSFGGAPTLTPPIQGGSTAKYQANVCRTGHDGLSHDSPTGRAPTRREKGNTRAARTAIAIRAQFALDFH